MTVIKDGQAAANPWTHLPDSTQPVDGPVTVPLACWLAEREALRGRGQPVGVRLAASDAPETLTDDLSTLPLIVLDMTLFTDGRAFTQARVLRERLGYRGEIRVRGDFLRDQMFFLSRVGVNAFEFPEGVDLADRQRAFREFTITYQAAADNPLPLYRRR